ncbi:MAG TPA: diguanylate cyclase [Thermomicrobiales bacterium]|nr:diguanylate cyclase [Thermomicrobiales bacterium]
MRAESETGRGTERTTGTARWALRAEIASAISGILERDHFLQRIARKIVEETGASGAALYVRSSPGADLVLRTSTLPLTEPIPPRVSPDAERARAEIIEYGDVGSDLRLDVRTTTLAGLSEPFGVLALFDWSEEPFTDEDQRALDEIALEIAAAIAVAEQHYAVKQASVTDLTTGAYTSWFLAQRFDEEIARAQRTAAPVTVVLASILDFDGVQRTLGYDKADMLLRALAAEFSGLMRVFDLVAMRSRSDFAILLPDTNAAQADIVISRAQHRSSRVIERLRVEYPELAFQVVTGAAAFPDDGDRVSTIMLAAEHRLIENETRQRRTTESA